MCSSLRCHTALLLLLRRCDMKVASKQQKHITRLNCSGQYNTHVIYINWKSKDFPVWWCIWAHKVHVWELTNVRVEFNFAFREFQNCFFCMYRTWLLVYVWHRQHGANIRYYIYISCMMRLRIYETCTSYEPND